jgi:hypothetical protein
VAHRPEHGGSVLFIERIGCITNSETNFSSCSCAHTQLHRMNSPSILTSKTCTKLVSPTGSLWRSFRYEKAHFAIVSMSRQFHLVTPGISSWQEVDLT